MSPLDEPTQSNTLFGRGPHTCAICAAELPPTAAIDSPLYPFCSRRCKLIDLHRWTEGRYAIVETKTLDEMLEAELPRETPDDGTAD